MVYTSPDSPWIKILKPFLEKKKRLQVDAWGYYPSEEIDQIFKVGFQVLLFSDQTNTPR